MGLQLTATNGSTIAASTPAYPVRIAIVGTYELFSFKLVSERVESLIRNVDFGDIEISLLSAPGTGTIARLWAMKYQLPIKLFSSRCPDTGAICPTGMTEAMAAYATHCIAFLDDDESERVFTQMAADHELKLRVVRYDRIPGRHAKDKDH